MFKLILFLILFLCISFSLNLFVKKRENLVVSRNSIVILDSKAALFLLLISLPLIILVAIRSPETGVDTQSYINAFNAGEGYMRVRANASGEFLFWYIYIFCYQFADFQTAFFIFASISIWITLISIYKLSYRSNSFINTLIFLLLFYQENFNLMRQMPAIALVFLSFSYVYERKLINFILVVFIAFLFHSSAIFAFPIYFLYKQSNRSIVSYLSLVIVILLIIFLFPDIFILLTDGWGYSRFQNYGSLLTIDESLGWLKSFFIWIPLFISMGLLLKSKDAFFKNLEDKKEIQFLWVLVLFFALFLLLRLYTNWVFRIGYYYQLGTVLLAGKITQRKKLSTSKLMINLKIEDIVFVLFYIFYYISLNYRNNYYTSALVNFQIAL